MAHGNFRASDCTLASASEQSLKADTLQITRNHFYQSMVTLDWNNAFLWRWLTMPKCALYIFLMVSMCFYHRYQLTHYLNHYWLTNARNLQINIRKPGKYRNAFSKYIVLCAAVHLPRWKIPRPFTRPVENPKALTLLQPAESVWEIQVNWNDANSCWDSLGKWASQCTLTFECFGWRCSSVPSLVESAEQTARDNHGRILGGNQPRLAYWHS